MPAPLLPLAVAAFAAFAGVQVARQSRDGARARAAWRELAAVAGPPVACFDPAMVAGLPEPARRYFRFAIQPGARLATVAEITMEGELSLGTKQDPRYQPMQADQILAAPHGLVWRVRSGGGALRVAGSDGMVGTDSWTCFWLLGLVAVVRAGGNADHLRAAFGRVVAEAAIWSPAALLPRPGVAWSQPGADTARVTLDHAGMRQDVDIRLDAAGQPLWVCMPRWSNANPDGVFRLQPFGGELSDFRSVDGFRLPFRVEGGNFFGTPDYFPFYRARVLSLRLR
ncbi:DUF6544 family protein [Ramlibacter sp.]|uniref:DUF6544 family protein n=1 Tax=Ramlibacter sp. TaxID=1917967 RepID=UPI002FCBD685